MSRWYYRHGGHVAGPYPQQAIERYLILGRLKVEDEVRTGDSAWTKIADCAEFASTCRLLAEGDEEQIAAARRYADERSHVRRHEEESRGEENRRGDRRGDEPEETREFRVHRAEVFEPPRYRSWLVYILIICLIALILVALALYHPVNPIKVDIG